MYCQRALSRGRCIMGRSRSSAHRSHSLWVVCRTPKAKYSVAGWQEEQLLCDDIAEVRNGNRILYVTTAVTTARGKLICSQQVCAAWASEPASNRCLGMCSTAATRSAQTSRHCLRLCWRESAKDSRLCSPYLPTLARCFMLPLHVFDRNWE